METVLLNSIINSKSDSECVRFEYLRLYLTFIVPVTNNTLSEIANDCKNVTVFQMLDMCVFDTYFTFLILEMFIMLCCINYTFFTKERCDFSKKITKLD